MSETTVVNTIVSHDKQDLLGPDFRARTLTLLSGVVCTLISYEPKKAQLNTNKAILYIHGYTDYFFQTGLAEYFHALGYRFYALDLQGYGRSIRPNRKPASCTSFVDYHQDLKATMDTMAADGITECIPLTHSMGSLVFTSYLRLHAQEHIQSSDSNKTNVLIRGVILNSPFLAMPLSLNKERVVLPMYRFLAKYLPFISLNTQHINPYSRSLHSSLSGEWPYRLDWKPAVSFPLSFAWLNQVMIEQELSSHTQINIPTLLCRSKVSSYLSRSVEEIRHGDGVLNVENMEQKTKAIYQDLTIAVIEGGFHDIYLSPQPIRDQYTDNIKQWLKENG